MDGFLARRRQGSAHAAASAWNLVAWAAGFAVYHACLGADSPLAAAWPRAFGFLGGWSSPAGSTIPAMAAAALLALPAAARTRARARSAT